MATLAILIHYLAHAQARAREDGIGGGNSPESPESHTAPLIEVTALKHCWRMDRWKVHGGHALWVVVENKSMIGQWHKLANASRGDSL